MARESTNRLRLPQTIVRRKYGEKAGKTSRATSKSHSSSPELNSKTGPGNVKNTSSPQPTTASSSPYPMDTVGKKKKKSSNGKSRSYTGYPRTHRDYTSRTTDAYSTGSLEFQRLLAETKDDHEKETTGELALNNAFVVIFVGICLGLIISGHQMFSEHTPTPKYTQSFEFIRHAGWSVLTDEQACSTVAGRIPECAACTVRLALYCLQIINASSTHLTDGVSGSMLLYGYAPKKHHLLAGDVYEATVFNKSITALLSSSPRVKNDDFSQTRQVIDVGFLPAYFSIIGHLKMLLNGEIFNIGQALVTRVSTENFRKVINNFAPHRRGSARKPRQVEDDNNYGEDDVDTDIFDDDVEAESTTRTVSVVTKPEDDMDTTMEPGDTSIQPGSTTGSVVTKPDTDMNSDDTDINSEDSGMNPESTTDTGSTVPKPDDDTEPVDEEGLNDHGKESEDDKGVEREETESDQLDSYADDGETNEDAIKRRLHVSPRTNLHTVHWGKLDIFSTGNGSLGPIAVAIIQATLQTFDGNKLDTITVEKIDETIRNFTVWALCLYSQTSMFKKGRTMTEKQMAEKMLKGNTGCSEEKTDIEMVPVRTESIMTLNCTLGNLQVIMTSIAEQELSRFIDLKDKSPKSLKSDNKSLPLVNATNVIGGNDSLPLFGSNATGSTSLLNISKNSTVFRKLKNVKMRTMPLPFVNAAPIIVEKDNEPWLFISASGGASVLDDVVSATVHAIIRNIHPVDAHKRERTFFDPTQNKVVKRKPGGPYDGLQGVRIVFVNGVLVMEGAMEENNGRRNFPVGN